MMNHLSPAPLEARSSTDRTQVWSRDDRLLGYMNCAVPKDGISLAMIEDLFDSYAEPDTLNVTMRTRNIRLEAGQRSFALDTFMIGAFRIPLEKLLVRNNVPESAQCQAREDLNEIVYTWNVLVASPADHEMIFDMDIFEPA